MKKILVVILAGFLIIAPLLFLWMLELTSSICTTSLYLTNGFMNFDCMQVYHSSMYLLFITNGLAFIYIVYNLRDDGKLKKNGQNRIV